ncbi:MAG TPA: ATP-binding protein [Verrucomicrobiae bacterium]|nr:ATP-binding protein [Verrucomicrobiae bacterium]
MRLKTKFILVSLLGGLSSVAIIGIVAYTKARQSIEQAVALSCQTEARETSEQVNRVVRNARLNVQQLSQMSVMEGVVNDDQDGAIQSYLMRFARVSKRYVRIVAINRDKRIVASSEFDAPDSRFTDKALIKQVLGSQPYFDDVHFDEPSHTWVTTMAYPIMARYNVRVVVGVLCAQWRVEELSDLLDLAEQGQPGEEAVQVMILRKDGLLIAGNHMPRASLFERNLRLEGAPSVALALKRKRGFVQEHGTDGKQVLVGYDFRIGPDDAPTAEWITLVRHDAVNLFAPIRILWRWVVIVGIVVTFGVFLLSLLVSYRLSSPIEEMAAVAEKVASGNFDIRVQRRSSDEVGTLARAFNKMIEDLKTQRDQLFTAQTSLMHADKMETVGRLAAGVAHEVKNPLTVISMGIEYLSTDFPSHGDQNVSTVLTEMQNSVERADTIVRGLLDFSASSHWDVADEDLNSAIERSLKLVRHDLVKGHINISTDLADHLPQLKLNRTKMEQVFINLFINAVHAMPYGGTLSVRTYAQPSRNGSNAQEGTADTVVAEVADTGTGIPQEVLTKIFEPFFTTKPTGVGTGLGMCVVKNIVELHGGTITMANRPEGGAKATITFKVKGVCEL